MSEINELDLFFSHLFSTLFSRKFHHPTTFESQCTAVKSIYTHDSSGLVDSLTDKMVANASTEVTVESEKPNSNFDSLLNEWLENLNSSHRGIGIKTGIKGLEEQYYKERWKYASFPIFYFGDWKKIGQSNNQIEVPQTILLLDGCSVRAREIDVNRKAMGLSNFNYYIGEGTENPLKPYHHFITRPYGRFFDEYPIPFLISRGIYRNWHLIDELKNKQDEVLEQVVPYLLLLKKGLNQLKGVTSDKIEEDVKKIKTALDKAKATGSTPAYGSTGDTTINHSIPELDNLFKEALIAPAEKAILSGFGLIDIPDPSISSRRESIINPRAYQTEVEKGQNDFAQVIKEFIAIIRERNNTHVKYGSEKLTVTIKPAREFMNKEIKDFIAQGHSRGNVSDKTYNELVLDVPYTIELVRRQEEAQSGNEEIMSARVIQKQDSGEVKKTEETKVDDDKHAENADEKYTIACIDKINLIRSDDES